MHQNIAGLLAKSNALAVCLQELTEKNTRVDILLITEHFMMESYEKHLNIHNYCLAACFCRKESKRGGACILVRNGHQWRELPIIAKISTTGVFECCAIELTNYKIVFVCIYRVPNPNNFHECMDKLEMILRILVQKCYKNIVLAGDFNIDVLKRNNQCIEFENLLLSYNLNLALYQPTRLKTCIDNFAHNFNKSCSALVLELALSDHTAQILKCPINITSTINQWRTLKRDYNEEHIDKFKSYLSSLTFSEVFEANETNVAYNAFIGIFSFLYKQCFPKTLISVNLFKKQKWISRGIKTCSKKKRQLLWQARLKPTQQNKDRFKNYSRLYRKIIQLTQRAQNNHKITTSKNKSKATWQIINQNKLNIPKNYINTIQENDTAIVDPKHIANLFNNYFIDKIQPRINSGTKVTKHILNRKNSMFIAPCLPQDVLKIISSLNNTYSTGYDGIQTKIIKSVAKEICKPLAHIINLCICEGTFPDVLKKSIVKPLYKKSDKELKENYRPISLVSIFSKIIESYIYKELSTYLEKHNILCNEQKGFRKNKTINMAIYDFLNTVMTNVDRNNPVCAIFCDMSQAFDYVQHDILLQKLETYGIRGNILKLLQSYLLDRKQVTEISRINSDTKREEIFLSEERNVIHGVPQGSVLGPSLFTLYINDFPKSINHPTTLFADDSTITIPCRHRDLYEEDVNNTLNKTIDWLDNNNLKININKTVIIHFGQRALTFPKFDIKYNNNTIDVVTTTKFLGLIIDRNLNWKTHIETVCKKISSSAFALYTLSWTLNIDALLTAYYGLTESILRYGVIFWGNSTNKEIAFKAQKRCLRSMFRLDIRDSCKPYFIRHKILTLPSLYILETALFVKRNPNLFPRMAESFPRNRRDKTKLCLHASRTALMRKSVICMAPIVYNKFPKSWKDLSSDQFKQKLKLFLVEKAYYSVSDFLNDKFGSI